MTSMVRFLRCTVRPKAMDVPRMTKKKTPGPVPIPTKQSKSKTTRAEIPKDS